MVKERPTYAQLWEEGLLRLLHPTQVLILEALAHLDCPVSATIMVGISDGAIRLGAWSYHLKRLVELGFLEETGSAAVRGATERFYGLRLGERS